MLIAILKVKANSECTSASEKSSSTVIWRLATDMDWKIRKIVAIEI